MTQEEKWFEYFTWNSDRHTEELILKPINAKATQSIQKPVEEYLESLGFRRDNTSPTVAIPSSGGWVLHLVKKTYKLEHKANIMNMIANRDIQTAYPSQLKEHMIRHFPVLLGKRFGL